MKTRKKIKQWQKAKLAMLRGMNKQRRNAALAAELVQDGCGQSLQTRNLYVPKKLVDGHCGVHFDLREGVLVGLSFGGDNPLEDMKGLRLSVARRLGKWIEGYTVDDWLDAWSKDDRQQ